MPFNTACCSGWCSLPTTFGGCLNKTSLAGAANSNAFCKKKKHTTRNSLLSACVACYVKRRRRKEWCIGWNVVKGQEAGSPVTYIFGLIQPFPRQGDVKFFQLNADEFVRSFAVKGYAYSPMLGTLVRNDRLSGDISSPYL